MNLKKSNLIILALGAILTFFMAGCNKFTQIPGPINKVDASLVYNDDASANSAVLSIYGALNSSALLTGNVSAYTGLSSDELNRFSPADPYNQLMINNLATNNTYVSSLWTSAYSVVAAANANLDGLNASTGLTEANKTQFTGEAKFLRAYSYFYLTNLFGNIPLLTSGNWQLYTTVTRTAPSEVYQQIIQDLNDAQASLPAAYSTGTNRATKWAAIALLARVKLYQQAWADAEANATAVITNSPLNNKPLPALASVFLIGSQEAILQIQPVSFFKNTQELNIIANSTSSINYYLTSNLLNAFEANDQRKASWLLSTVISGTTYYYPYKYKVLSSNATPTEYHTPMRLAEQYLIRAEARAHQNNISDAVTDLNIIRTRAGLPNLVALGMSQAQCLTAVEQERRVELFGEWGHRWLDLKRTPGISGGATRADEVLGVLKGANWQSTDKLYPIPASEILLNNNLSQNPGY